MEEIFSGRGLTLLIQIKDHARGIESTDKSFPAAIREMIKTATAIPSLLLRDWVECCARLTEYLTSISERNGLDVNLQQVVQVLQGRVEKWRVQGNFRWIP